MCDTFDEAVARMSEVLAIPGRVLPVTNENVQLLADFDDGVTVTGESQIAEYKKDLTRRIVRAYLSPEHPAALPACLDAIREADLIVLGPGSLYTSVIPNLLVSGIREAIHESDAVKVYVMNLMTQSGETAGYTAVDHVRALFDHGGEGLFDYTLVNNLPIPPEAQEEYLREGAVPITADEEALAALGVTVRYAPVALWQKALVRHDPAALAVLTRAAHTARGRLSPERVRALYGKRLYLSASKAERFSACRYAYFLQYGLRAKPRRPAAFSPPEIGTFFHYVLQHTAQDVTDGGRRLRRRDGRAARYFHRPLDAALHPRRTQ